MEAVKPGIVIIDEAELSPAAVPEGLLAEGIVGLEPDPGGIIFIPVDQPPVGHDAVPGIMLMCHKVTRKNLIDSSPLFPCNKEKAIHNLHLNDIILLGQSKGKIKVYAP